MSVRVRRKLELGYSHFVQLRKAGSLVVDKTMFIQHVLDCPHRTMLIPRPRRFGKTFNLGVLESFFETRDEDFSPYFSDMQVWQSSEARAHFQKHPVLWLSFKDCKAEHWADAWSNLQDELIGLLSKHKAVLTTPGILSEEDARWYTAGLMGALKPVQAARILKVLSLGLYRLTGAQVVILIDEYDTPIHDALEHRYYKKVIRFFKRFFNAGFKDNDALFRGVITGILRVSKENMFSDLNHLGVYTLLKDEFKTDFGLTQEEVIEVLDEQGCPELLPGIERMYNGYLFGTHPPVAIYNPWSTLSCIAVPNHELYPYWNKSGSPELLHAMVVKNGPGIHAQLQQLLEEQTLAVTVSDNVSLTALERSPADLFSFMLFTGYLKATQVEAAGQNWNVRLGLVNGELRQILSGLYQDFLLSGRATPSAEPLVRAVLSGNAVTLEEELTSVLEKSASFLDGATRTPENFYQGLLLGLLTLLKPEHEVISNLESGRGRADLLVIPRTSGRVGVVMELKVVKAGSTHAEALLAGLTQIEEKCYTARLEARHASPIHAYAVAFDGKDVRVALESDRATLALERAEQKQAASTPSVTPAPGVTHGPATVLPTPVRLALEGLVGPQLTPQHVRRMWSLCGYIPPAVTSETHLDDWDMLLLRCASERRIADLADVLCFTFPALAGDPLIAKLKEAMPSAS